MAPTTDLDSVAHALEETWRGLCPAGRLAVSFRKIEHEADDRVLSRLTPAQLDRYNRLKAGFRRLQWSESRRSEQALMELLGKSDGRIFTSISHSGLSEKTETDQYVLAAGLGTGHARIVAGIGVDIEKADRKVDGSMDVILIAPEERKHGLSLLDFWVIKEACFKANPRNEKTALPQYVVESMDLASGKGTLVGPGGTRYIFHVTHTGPWKATLALHLA